MHAEDQEKEKAAADIEQGAGNEKAGESEENGGKDPEAGLGTPLEKEMD